MFIRVRIKENNKKKKRNFSMDLPNIPKNKENQIASFLWFVFCFFYFLFYSFFSNSVTLFLSLPFFIVGKFVINSENVFVFIWNLKKSVFFSNFYFFLFFFYLTFKQISCLKLFLWVLNATIRQCNLQRTINADKTIEEAHFPNTFSSWPGTNFYRLLGSWSYE